jgi:hypothetical protein
MAAGQRIGEGMDKSTNCKSQVTRAMIFAGCAALLALAGGCETIKEGCRGVLGKSTKMLEESRDNAVIKEFAFDYESTVIKTKKALHDIGAYVYREVAAEPPR